jgi:DNA-binding NarL/FixJ family response regulator
MSKLRIVLAEDHTLVRAGIRALLEQIDDIEVVAEAADGRSALEAIKQHRPDVVFMDIGMPNLNGLDATARVAQEFPGVRVLVLSMHAHEEYVWQALHSGAAGYLLKDAGTTELEIAVRAVARGETYLTPAVSKHVVESYIRRFGGETSQRERLTARQREILQLVAEGNTTKEIALQLHLSSKTVETYRAQLMEQLDIHDVAGLVRYALRIGLISLD